MGIDET
jgi:hypothetical protein